MIYSYSKLNTFENCPLKFRYQYIDKLISEVGKSIEAFLGSMVHETLEWLYKQVKMNKVPETEEVLKIYEGLWKKNFDEESIFFVNDFTNEDFFELGKKFLVDYYKRYHPFKENTIATEKRILINLDKKGKYKLQGYVDRLVYNKKEGAYEIHDYKTGSHLKTTKDLEIDKQLGLYSLGIKEMYPDADRVCLIWHFLAFDKEFCSERTEEQLEALKEQTIELIKKIESTKEFSPKTSRLCGWCEFKTICPKWKHFEDIKNKPVNEYLKEKGVSLVNKYAEILLKKQTFNLEVEEELKKIKEALVKYAESKNLDTVFGSDKKARIWVKEVTKFPGKNEPGREALIKLLKMHGKYNEFSDVDTFKLSNSIGEQKLPDELLEKLSALSTKEKIERIYLSKNEKEK